MRIRSLILVAFASLRLTSAGELPLGERLPQLNGEYLSGHPAALPHDAEGKVALLLLGFSHSAQPAVEGWTKKFRAQFQSDPRVTFFEIPMIGGLARMAKPFIDHGMRQGTPKQDHDHVITVYGGTDPWKQRLQFRDPKAAYLILLDQKGRVARRANGFLDAKTYQELASKVSRLLAAD